jgi:hypothetical protein
VGRLANLFVCAQLFCAAGATAQVPRVLGVWELELDASQLPNGFRWLSKRAVTICVS